MLTIIDFAQQTAINNPERSQPYGLVDFRPLAFSSEKTGVFSGYGV